MTFTVLLEYYYWLQNPNIANVFFFLLEASHQYHLLKNITKQSSRSLLYDHSNKSKLRQTVFFYYYSCNANPKLSRFFLQYSH